jgi:translation initiation factor IF-2
MVYLGKNKRQRLSKKQIKAQKKTQAQDSKRLDALYDKKDKIQVKVEGVVKLGKVVTVRGFAEKLGIPPTKIIEKLLENGIMATINESIDFESAAIIADEFGVEVKELSEVKKDQKVKHANLKYRPPVVVVLGHVDHGKTTLLDSIRKSDIASSESGGITQHIGAYQVLWKDKKNIKTPITFLDTPGHEAFSTMRAHGANITDIAILVVAADDGVKPQTKEAISHIKSANVPVIVAINKIDKPEADVDKVKRELGKYDLIPEQWGGDTVMCEISAKNKKGIDNLLDMIILTSQMREIKADYKSKAEAVIIESHMQIGVGPVATILLQHGTLSNGKNLVIGDNVYAKIKFIEDYLGKRISKATPAMPVKIAGLSNVPNFGDKVREVSSEREAKNIVNKTIIKKSPMDAYRASEAIKSGKLKNLAIVLKVDTQGSLGAIKNTIEQLESKNTKVSIVSCGIGTITENDINMAIASNAIILGFKVKCSTKVNVLVREKKIKIKIYDIIYRIIEDVQNILNGMIEPEFMDVIIGKLEVIKLFHKTNDRKLIGGKVVDGKFIKGEQCKIYHSGDQIGNGKIVTLQIEKNQLNEIKKGQECGGGIMTKVNIKPGDIVEQYQKQEITS